MSFREHVTVLRERWLLVVLGVAVGLSGGCAFAFLSTPQYASSTTYFISTPDQSENASSAYQGQLLSAQKIKSYTELATGRRIRDEVSRVLGSPVEPGAITASARPDTVLLTIRVTDPSPRRAHQIVTLAADRFTTLVAEVERPTDKGVPLVVARQVQAPEVPTTPIAPRKTANVAIGFILGLMAGVGAAIARHTLDRSVKSPELLSDLVGAPVLGTMTFDSRIKSHPLIVHDQPRSALAEAFRQIRTNLEYIDLDHPEKLIVITSALPGEGKTTTACNLAIALAQAGNRVALVEADLRRPKAAEYLGMENAVGLTNVLTGQVDLETALQPWGGGLFDFLGAGPLPPNPSELLASQQMVLILEDLNQRYDMVLLDGAPTLPVADAAVLAANCHGVVMVARHGRVKVDQARVGAANLHRVSANIFGVVMTMTPRSKRRQGGAYSYQYGYYGYSAARQTKWDDTMPALGHVSGAASAPVGAGDPWPVPMARTSPEDVAVLPPAQQPGRGAMPRPDSVSVIKTGLPDTQDPRRWRS